MQGLALHSNCKMRLFLIFTVLLLFAACAPKQVPVNYDEINIDEILLQVKSNQETIKSLRGVARVKAKSSYDDLVINQVTLLQLPLKFRLEALAAFGQSIAVLTSDGEKVIFKTSNDQVVFQDVENFNLSHFYPGIPRELKTPQLIDLLLGKIPFGLWIEDYSVNINKEKGKIEIYYINSNNTETRLSIDPLTGYLERADVDLGNSNILSIDYTNYIKLDNLVFPKAIYLKYLSYELSIKYGDLSLNDKIEDSLFFQ